MSNVPFIHAPTVARRGVTYQGNFTGARERCLVRPSMNDAQGHKTLSPQQERILASCKNGFVYKEIAQELGVSVNTVKAHMKRLFAKMGVNNRQQAIQAHFGGRVEPQDQRPISIPIIHLKAQRIAA
ncbi:MAG: ATP-dependent transcriptional regulator, MalT-like, LuxR family [Pedosphaera sp.]|nr:ATP-dependent transcriptional regulator, MalT-like, LuxR family [Pedosphaera sp.]